MINLGHAHGVVGSLGDIALRIFTHNRSPYELTIIRGPGWVRLLWTVCHRRKHFQLPGAVAHDPPFIGFIWLWATLPNGHFAQVFLSEILRGHHRGLCLTFT